MAQINPSLPTIGQPDSTEEPKVLSALQTLITLVNGNLDSANLAAGAVDGAELSSAVAAALGITANGSTRRGKSIIATSESTTSTSFTTLATPDKVSGIVLPTDGLIAVSYQATWKETVTNAARAAIFVGANQLKVPTSATAPVVVSGMVQNGAGNFDTPLTSCSVGLFGGGPGGSYTGDVTTGQAAAFLATGVNIDYNNGSTVSISTQGGPCYISAAAGTYDISVQFKTSSGTVTAKNRSLRVWTIGF